MKKICKELNKIRGQRSAIKNMSVFHYSPFSQKPKCCTKLSLFLQINVKIKQVISTVRKRGKLSHYIHCQKLSGTEVNGNFISIFQDLVRKHEILRIILFGIQFRATIWPTEFYFLKDESHFFNSSKIRNNWTMIFERWGTKYVCIFQYVSAEVTIFYS